MSGDKCFAGSTKAYRDNYSDIYGEPKNITVNWHKFSKVDEKMLEGSIEVGTKIKAGTVLTEAVINFSIVEKNLELTEEIELLRQGFNDRSACIGCVSGDPACSKCHLSSVEKYLRWCDKWKKKNFTD